MLSPLASKLHPLLIMLWVIWHLSPWKENRWLEKINIKQRNNNFRFTQLLDDDLHFKIPKRNDWPNKPHIHHYKMHLCACSTLMASISFTAIVMWWENDKALFCWFFVSVCRLQLRPLLSRSPPLWPINRPCPDYMTWTIIKCSPQTGGGALGAGNENWFHIALSLCIYAICSDGSKLFSLAPHGLFVSFDSSTFSVQ